MIETEHLLYGLGGIVASGLVIILVMLALRSSRAKRHRKRETELKASVSLKAAMTELALTEEEAAARGNASLSDSGAFAIHALVDTLVRAGDLDAAEIWASNALRTDPDHVEVALKLAGIYHRRQKRSEFFEILSKHVIKRRNDIDAGEWRKIEAMVADFSSAQNAQRSP
jgi:thioredoxin-like negative regulator of GroEL